MKKLLVYLKDYKKESILGPLFKLLEASFELLVPLVVTKIIDVGIATGDVHYIVRMVLLMVGLALIGLICSITAQYFAAKAAVGFAAGLKSALFRHIQSLSYSEMDHLGTASLITRMTSDVNQLQSGVNLVLRLFLRSPFIVFGAMVMAFTIDVRSALVFAVAIPLLSVVVFGIMLLTMPLYRRAQAGLDRLLRRTRENLSGVRVIRAFHKEAEETAQFAEENESLTRLQLFVGRISALMNPLTYVLINGAIVALIWTGAWQVERGALTQGQVVALVNYMSQILVELIKLANLIITITKAAACARRIESVFDENSSMTFPGEPAQDDPTAQDAVVFENVALRYSGAGAESLSGLSFRVRRGQTVGIIGGTGSGKSSLVNLIPRFYDATDGRILVDGVDVRDYPAGQLRSKIGIVPQKAVLFAGTVAENLRWGKEDATEAELQVALETSQAAEFVLDPRGRAECRGRAGRQEPLRRPAAAPDHRPRARARSGNSHSGRQRLCTGLRDGCASAQGHPRPRRRMSPYFMVSQRAASIQYADQILVLDDGALVGQGTHAELLESCPVYQEIYYSQFPKEAHERMKKTKTPLRKLLRYLKKYWLLLALSLLFAALTVAMTLYLPILIGQAVDLHRRAGAGGILCASPACCSNCGIRHLALTALSQWIMNACNNRITYRTVRDIRSDAFARLEILPLRYIDAHSYGEIVSRMIADVDQFADGLLMGFTQFFTGVLTIVGTLLLHAVDESCYHARRCGHHAGVAVRCELHCPQDLCHVQGAVRRPRRADRHHRRDGRQSEGRAGLRLSGTRTGPL